MIQLGYFIEYAVRVIFIPSDILPENTEIGTALIHHMYTERYPGSVWS